MRFSVPEKLKSRFAGVLGDMFWAALREGG